MESNPLVFDELPAKEPITPGHLVQWSQDNKLQRHPTKAGNVVPAFALPKLTGEGEYEIDEPVRVGVYAPGMQVEAWIVRGTHIKMGEMLESAGTGALRRQMGKRAKKVEPVVAMALEEVDNFSGYREAKILVQIA